MEAAPDPVADAEARAARNGLRLEVGDIDLSSSWPGKRMAAVWLFNGRDQVAGCALTYSDEASRKRALSFCCSQVYNRPDRAD